MKKHKFKIGSLALLLVLALSGASFGFLLGKSHQAYVASESREQIQAVTTTVQTGGAIVTRFVSGIRTLLIQ